MERIMTHVGGGGGSSGGSLVVAAEEEHSSNSNINSNTNMGVSSDEASSYPHETELQLGLDLSLTMGGGGGGGGNKQQLPRILTAKDLPCMGLRALKASPSSSSSSSCLGGAGTKRPAETSPTGTGVSQVVGWPPVSASRMNRLANHAKTVTMGQVHPNKGDGVLCNSRDMGKADHNGSGHIFVKVNMDGIGIGRKVDLNAHSSYDSLAHTLVEMFAIPTKSDTLISNKGGYGVLLKAKISTKLLDGSSDFVITYEDKDGDWMLVGDVPWGLFLSSVNRLRIMRTSEANGLESRFGVRTCKLQKRPV